MPLSVTTMNQVRVAWTGFNGGPGVSTFYTDGASVPNVAALRTFFNAIVSLLPPSCTIVFPSSGDSLSPEDGSLEGAWSVGTPPANVVGTGTGSMTATQGPQIVWTTDEIADGRAVKGRTFLVPSLSGVFGADGDVTSSSRTTFTTAATTLRGSTPSFVIWHRPKKGPKPVGGGPRPLIRPGGWARITGNTTALRPAVLTSRRD